MVVAGRFASWIAGVPSRSTSDETTRPRTSEASARSRETVEPAPGTSRPTAPRSAYTAGAKGGTTMTATDRSAASAAGAATPSAHAMTTAPTSAATSREAPTAGGDTAARPVAVTRHARIVLAPVHPLTPSPSPGRPRRTRRRGPPARARSAPQQPRPEPRRRRGPARRCSRGLRRAGGAGRRRAPRCEPGLDHALDSVRLEHVRGRCDRCRSETKQGVRPRRDSRRDLAGNDHHLAPVLEGEVRCDQRPRALARLDDDGCRTETGNDPVPRREAPGRGLDPRLVLRHDQPLSTIRPARSR